MEGEAVKAFYRNGLMDARAYACARDFLHLHPAQGVLIFAEWGRRRRRRSATSFVHASGVCSAQLPSCGGADSLAANAHPCPEPMPFAAAANHAASLAPPISFSARDAPLVGKETTLSKSCGSAGARAEGNGGGERSVHIGTTKD